MLSGTKLVPTYNGYQYIIVFFLGVIFDLIIHFFSSRKYNALKSGKNAVGFAPELMIYYRSLSKKGPFPYTQGADSFYNTLNSYLLGILIAGFLSLIIIVLSDLILQFIEYRNRTSV